MRCKICIKLVPLSWFLKIAFNKQIKLKIKFYNTVANWGSMGWVKAKTCDRAF